MNVIDKIIPKDLNKKILDVKPVSSNLLELHLEWYELNKYLNKPNVNFSPVVSRFEWNRFWRFHNVYKAVRAKIMITKDEFYSYAHNASEILDSLYIKKLRWCYEFKR